MDEALFALLGSNPGVTAQVDARIFWGLAPQGTDYPRISMFIISGRDSPHLKGTDGLWRFRVQIDCYGADRPTARGASRAVTKALNGHRGGGFQGIFIDGMSREGREDDAVDKPYRFSHDFFVNWRNSNV